MKQLDPLCDTEHGGCGHFLTVHTRGLKLWDRCLLPGCDCKKAVIKMADIALTKTFVTGAPIHITPPKIKDESLKVLQETMPKDETPLTEPVLDSQQPQKVSIGKRGAFLADEFIRIAKANNNIVTHQQAKEVNPQSPADLAYYAKQRGCEIVTDKKKGGGTTWTLLKEN